jgi:hypothetical protein
MAFECSLRANVRAAVQLHLQEVEDVGHSFCVTAYVRAAILKRVTSATMLV